MAQDYQILNSVQSLDLSPAGYGFDHNWEITYKVTDGPAKGTIAKVTVPDADHNAKYVDAAIREKLEHLHAIASLGSS